MDATNSPPHSMELKPKPFFQLNLSIYIALNFSQPTIRMGFLCVAFCTSPTSPTPRYPDTLIFRVPGDALPEQVTATERCKIVATTHLKAIRIGLMKAVSSYASFRQENMLVQRVTVRSLRPETVEMVNFHIKHGKESMDSIGSPTDSIVIMQILEDLEALAKLGIEVEVVAGGISAEITSRATGLVDDTTNTHRCLGGNCGRSPASGVGIKRFCHYCRLDRHARRCHAMADERNTPGTVKVKKGKDDICQISSKLQACKITKR